MKTVKVNTKKIWTLDSILLIKAKDSNKFLPSGISMYSDKDGWELGYRIYFRKKDIGKHKTYKEKRWDGKEVMIKYRVRCWELKNE